MVSLRKKWLENKTLAREQRAPDVLLQPRTAISVSKCLSPERIHFFGNVTGHAEVLEQLVGSLGLTATSCALEALRERENKGSTVITPGLAFPHARIAGLSGIAAALGICPAGLSFPYEENPVRFVFLFLSPSENTGGHLRFLAGASSLFLRENFMARLLELETPEQVLSEIRDAESGKAMISHA